ncbi:sulfatase [Nocardioides sp. Root1257]|uniref:sulfatase-like hydrolase/transferase n=1 Tax=unclassified Nocardioides TaxID=2615069 RepID=UPI0007018DDE|nr:MULTISPECIES: sulfatase-like hydrolase/transferase [unclassified Nocardioides]KQW52778.1 sulfatase [Nocardioides sp. Root1257]KRC55466.1 sulfatase [Nocardioides sp. Root224]
MSAPATRPDVVILMTDEERAAPSYEGPELAAWRERTLAGTRWFREHGVSFERHYTGSLACVPSRPTIFTGQYPDVHGVTQTDGLGKSADDSRMRWLPRGEVPTLGNWFRAAGYDTHYDGKWHISHADLHTPDGRRVETNTPSGEVVPDAVQQYVDADPLAPYGFSGWVGPEPHGASLSDSGLRRDPLIADRLVAWLEDRYQRRRAGDPDALRPFLLVASFVNPHDIVLFPKWVRRMPIAPSHLDPPHVTEPPTANEDLALKPAAQIAFRESYPSAYGPPSAIGRIYRSKAQAYRDLYYRLHAEADAPLDRVRRTVTAGSTEAVLVRTSDHGDLLGAHGGLHQKWFNLYDEATRVPFIVARTGGSPTGPATVSEPTSHVDLVPTLLAAAGIDADAVAARLREDFSEVHPLPGRDLMPVVADPALADHDRAVYLITRDNMLEGDTGLSGLARQLGRKADPPAPLRIQVAAHVGANFEGVVARAPSSSGRGHLWKLVRTFDDPATWTEPGRRHLAANGAAGPEYRTVPVPDQWELYDLTADPVESVNRWDDPACSPVLDHLRTRLKEEQRRCVPERNHPWPYVARRQGEPDLVRPPKPARALRRLAQRLGMHPDDADAVTQEAAGRRALVIATNHATLGDGTPTGVFSSELTVPYYYFEDAGMYVDVASPLGGVVPVDPMSLKPVLRTTADDRYLGDDILASKLQDSLAIADVDVTDYDLVYLAGGWGAAFDLGDSEPLAEQMTAAAAAGLVIGGVCHGPLGLVNATAADGRPLVEGRKVSAVTDKQVRELRITSTPRHPETELRKRGALFESATRFRDPFANHWVVDGDLVTGQNQNAAPMVAREMVRLVLTRETPR